MIWTNMYSVNTSSTSAPTITEIQDLNTQKRVDNMTRGQQQIFAETWQSDSFERHSHLYHGDVIISPSASMTNLVINNDAMTGSTEVQLMKHLSATSSSKTSTTPPISPMGRNSKCPDSPLSPFSPNSFDGSSKFKSSCQKRGRFLVWPVSTVLPSTTVTSPIDTSSTTSTDSSH
jgi:hypothetical protein